MHCSLLMPLMILVQAGAGQDQIDRKQEFLERTPVAAWRFEETDFTGGVISDQHGELDLRLLKGGLDFTGEGALQSVRLGPGARKLDLAVDVDPSTLLPGDAFSIAAWVRIDQPRDWAGLFSAIQDNGAHERGWVTGISGERFFMGLVGDEGDEKITYLFSKARLETGRWHHVSATWDGRRMRLYLDGMLDSESFAEKGSVRWPERTTIALGAYTDDDSRYSLVGGLHSVALYDVALESNEIAGLNGRLAGLFPVPETPEDELVLLPEETVTGWPTYRRDARRSGATPEALDDHLTERWRHEAMTPPRPSWPEPARSSFWQEIDEIVPRVVFDECFHPVSDGTVVLYGSSADDHVRCLDLSTGELLWRHATNGPVRFAPVIDGDGVLFGSDDGTLRRVRLADGAVEWTRQLAPDDRKVVGNGRLISAWPPRTGPVLDRGRVSITSGLFPKFGTWATTLDARTGETLWRVELPGISPQGYLLASPTRLFVPTGRTSPVMLGRGDGRNLGRFEGPGGTFAILVEDELLTGPGSRGQLSVADQSSRETVAGFDAEHGIVVEDLVILARQDTVTAIDRDRLRAVLEERAKLERLHGDLLTRRESGEPITIELEATAERLRALQDELEACRLWRKQLTACSLALADGTLVIGGHDRVHLVSARTGDELREHPVDGRPLGLAIAGGNLLVSTDRGSLHCFGDGDGTKAPNAAPNLRRRELEPGLAALISAHGMDRGIAIMVEPTDAERGLALADELRLHVIMVEPDERRARMLRDQVLAAGVYGDGVAVLQAEPGAMGIDAIANVVILGSGLDAGTPTSKEDLLASGRLVRPDGGLLIIGGDVEVETALENFEPLQVDGLTAWRRKPLEGVGDWTHAYADAANTTNSNDTTLTDTYALRWFGGPGAGRMVDRHLRTTASLAGGGRLFIPGNDIVIGVDAYNGLELWSTPLPGFTRTGAPYDGGWWALGPTGLFAAAGDLAYTLDTTDGSIVARHEVPLRAREACGPVGDPRPRCEWGWLALDGARLLGTAALPGTARLEQNRVAVVDQYSENEPLATSRALFSIDRPTGKVDWVYREGVIVNSTIAVRDGRIIFLESRADPALEKHDGRVTLEDLQRGPLDLVAIDLKKGRRLWRVPIEGGRFKHSVFVAMGPEQVALVGCTNDVERNRYHVAAHDPATGRELWRADHANNRAGTGGDHGEQVHHPVLLDGILIAEPHAYDLVTGEEVNPSGGNDFYLKSRSGCGTISASYNCLFFRDGNPAVLELTSGSGTPEKLTQASRQGCWVNVIPAQGMALIPESSSGCVCGYSLQTSIGLVPVEVE
ncbi:MAG: PQQ-binding-like beta-propeller repeat protein [Phycisphaerales bacterium]|nr:PQQ-binding-like beta-propeller repeat protein [Phycisphaerales bacterium]